MEVAYFCKAYHCVYFPEPTLHCTSAAPTPPHCYCSLLKVKKYEVGVASSGITFVPNFMKIGQFKS
jgi:hypothetical protein